MRKTLIEDDFITIRKMYLEDAMSLHDIAKQFYCSYATVSRFLKLHDIKVRSAGEQTTIFVRRNGSPNIGRFKGFSYEQIYGNEKAKWMREVRSGDNNGFSKVAYKYTGKNNNNWKGGIKPLTATIRGCDKNKELIKTILERDSFTCQKCGKVGGKLEVDHIVLFSTIFTNFLIEHNGLNVKNDKQKLFELSLKYPMFWNEENLRVLCRPCNQHRNKKGRNK